MLVSEKPLTKAERRLLERTLTLLPVTCPLCGTQSVSKFPTIVVTTALIRWNNMALHSSCHEGVWNASQAELMGIRAYLGDPWIEAHRHLVR